MQHFFQKYFSDNESCVASEIFDNLKIIIRDARVAGSIPTQGEIKKKKAIFCLVIRKSR
jgi:hypothetical protein